MSLEYEDRSSCYSTWSPVSSCHSKYMCIIENRQQGTPCPMTQELSHIKMTRQQTMSILAIFLFTMSMVFLKMVHRILIIVMLQVSTMIRHGVSLTYIKTPWTY